LNDWLDKEKFRQLPKLNSVLPPGSELYGLERQVRGDGVIFRPVRIDADNIPGGGGGGLIGKELISGGAVWSGTGLIFDVSVLFYRFGENYGTAGPAQVTLDNADPTNPRIDAIVVNEAGMIYVVTGVPSPDPGTPEIAEDELLVQLILVDAGATTPSINIEYIYRDNADWITSTYVTSGPAATGIDFESTDDPYEGTFCIEVNNEDSRKGLRFVRPAGTVDLSNYPILVFWIRFPSVLPANRNLLASVWNGATSVGNVVNFMPLGINRNLVGVWQQVVCPTSAFNASVINRLQMRMDGGGVGVGVSWDLDLIALYTGFAPPSSLSTVSVQENGTTIGSRPTLNFRDGGGVTWDINDSEPQNRININASVVPPITKLGTYFLDDSTTALPPGEISFGSFADITWNGASATKTIYLSFSDLDGNTFRPERFLERGAIIMQRVSNPDDFIVLPIAARAGIGVVPPAIGYMILTTQPEVDGVLQWTGLTSGEFIDVYHIMVSRQTPIYVPSITTPGAFQDALAGFRKGDVISGSDRQPKICTLEAAFSAVWEDYPAGGSGSVKGLKIAMLAI